MSAADPASSAIDRPASTGEASPRLAVSAVVLRQPPEGPEVLLVRRARAPYEGHWSFPGGSVRLDERLHAAVAREVREETALAVRVERLLEVVEVLEEGKHFVILNYVCATAGGEPRAGDDAAEVAWVSAFGLAERTLTPGVARIVARALAEDDE